MALLVVSGTVAFASTNLSVAVPLYCLALLLGILWAVKLLTAKSVCWNKSLMHLPVAGFALYAIIRYFTSPLEYYSRVELFRILTCTLLYFVAAFNFHHRRDRTVLVLTLLFLAFGESLFALGQFYTKATTIFGYPRPSYYFSRGSGTFFCPNHLAALLEMVLGVTIARLALHSTEKENLQKIVLQKMFLAFGIIVIMTGLVATASRSGLLASIVSLAVLLFWGEWKLPRLWPRFLVVGVGLVLLFLLAFKTEGISNRFVQTYIVAKGDNNPGGNPPVSTLSPRIKIWKATVTMIREHPLSGTGGGTWEWLYPQYRPPLVPANPEYPHNEILNVLSDYGLIGFTLIAIALTCFYGQAYELARAKISTDERAFAVGVAMAVTASVAHSVFDFNLHIFSNAAVFTILMGMVVAIREGPEENRVPMTLGARRALAVTLLAVCSIGGWFVAYAALAHRYTVMGDEVKLNDWEQAEIYYRKAMLLDTKSPVPPARLGDLLLKQSQWRVSPAQQNERQELARGAVQFYQQSLKINPYYVVVLNRLARAYEILQDKEEVIKTCERAMELDPRSPVTPLLLAKFYLRQDDLPQAEKAALKAASLNFGYNDPAPGWFLEEIRFRQKKPQ